MTVYKRGPEKSQLLKQQPQFVADNILFFLLYPATL